MFATSDFVPYFEAFGTPRMVGAIIQCSQVWATSDFVLRCEALQIRQTAEFPPENFFLARISRPSLSSDLSEMVSTPTLDHGTFNCSKPHSIPGTVIKEPERILLRVKKKIYCLRQVHLAENLPRATHTQNRVETT